MTIDKWCWVKKKMKRKSSFNNFVIVLIRYTKKHSLSLNAFYRKLNLPHKNYYKSKFLAMRHKTFETNLFEQKNKNQNYAAFSFNKKHNFPEQNENNRFFRSNHTE